MTGANRIATASAVPYRLPLVRPWVSSHGRLSERRGLLVRVSTRDGRVGWGDCAPLEEIGSESYVKAVRYLPAALADLVGREVDPETLDPAAPPASRCALDTALLDLVAQAQGAPLYRCLGGEGDGTASVNANVGGLDAGVRVRVAEALARGFRLLKFKLGLRTWTEELLALRTLLGHFGSALTLRLDANQAWSLPVARKVVERLNDYPVESLEEPLRQFDPDALAQLQSVANFPLALDESVGVLADRESPVRRLVLKPVALGGLSACLRIVRKTDAQCVITSSIDSAVGVRAAAHLACALDNGLAHGLDTGCWLRSDLADPVPITGGRLRLLPDAAGLGVHIRAGWAERPPGSEYPKE